MINILHIDTERTWRGGQRQATYLFEALYKRGYKTKMICRPNSKLQEFCRQKKLPYKIIPMKNEFCLFSALKIAKMCKSENYQIAHLHSAHAVAVGFWLKLFYPEIILIGMRRVDFKLKRNFFSRLKYSKLDKLVCISKKIEEVVQNSGFENTKLIYSGIDLNRFSDVEPVDIKQELSLPEDSIIIGTTAALVGHKDFPTMLEAAKIVCWENEKANFVVLGDGHLKEELREMRDNLGLKNRFFFAGFKKNVGAYLKSFDIFALSSQKEGLGTSILDAQALGLPVVACKSGGIPEAVYNEENGFLVPKKNPEAFANALLKLMKNKKLIKKMGEMGLNTVKKFNIQKTIDNYLSFYYNLLKENNSL